MYINSSMHTLQTPKYMPIVHAQKQQWHNLQVQLVTILMQPNQQTKWTLNCRCKSQTINQFKIGRPNSESVEMHRSVTGRIGCEKRSCKTHGSVFHGHWLRSRQYTEFCLQIRCSITGCQLVMRLWRELHWMSMSSQSLYIWFYKQQNPIHIWLIYASTYWNLISLSIGFS